MIFFFGTRKNWAWSNKNGDTTKDPCAQIQPFSDQLFICLLCLSWSHVSLRFVARNPLILKHGKKWCWYIEIYIYIYIYTYIYIHSKFLTMAHVERKQTKQRTERLHGRHLDPVLLNVSHHLKPAQLSLNRDTCGKKMTKELRSSLSICATRQITTSLHQRCLDPVLLNVSNYLQMTRGEVALPWILSQ